MKCRPSSVLLALAEVIAGRNQVLLKNENQGIEGNETSRYKFTFFTPEIQN